MLTGNKGEWSEFYVLLKLLSEGKLYAADEGGKRLDNMYFPILSIWRKEKDDKSIEYDIPVQGNQTVAIYLNDEQVASIERSRLTKEAKVLYDCIVKGGDRAFAIPVMNDIMDSLFCEKLAAPATDKTDIQMYLHDIQTGYDQLTGFSIKSELGHSPTLLNASRATNFIYEVIGLNNEDMEVINQMDNPRSKIMDRMSRIQSLGCMEYREMSSKVFSNNLMLIDTEMDRVIAEALRIYYLDNENSCREVIKKLEDINPLKIERPGFYTYKFKKFLCSVALGMVPSREWDGRDESNGGYIIVNKEGDVLAYHIYNRDNFESYLLNNTRFERASTTRHEYAMLYKREQRMYINLNLQVRFK